MLRFAVFALLVAAAAASSIRVSPSITATRGVVGGVVPCGSKGQVLEIRVTDCTTLPCDLTVGNTYLVEVDFIPSVDHSKLTVLVSIITDGKETEIINSDVDISVVAGTAYTVAYPLTITGSLAQGNVALRIQVADSGVTELCGLATAIIHA